ncbi:MAG: UMP kinase [Lachnospiraceae bacterium]|nr:UMP kinase [Lachnospiraceae bacterium]
MSENRRVLLKLSGEALAGENKSGFDEDTVRKAALQVKKAADEGTQLAIVIGGGNFWRGRSSKAIDRTKADSIGMLATVMNCLYVSEIFRSVGMQTEIYTPFICGTMTKLFSKDAAVADLEEGKVIFFAGGTGHPYFSTDTICVLRAVELEADEILLAKSIDGVYDSDPKTNPNAKKYDTISIGEIVEKDLKVIDGTAAAMCRDYPVPMQIFDLNEENSIYLAMQGRSRGTRITV